MTENNTGGLTDFGFTKVKREDKTGMVSELFSGVAGKYDLMNDLMSGGAHRLWKRRFVSSLPLTKNMHVLDMAGGTGDITLLMRKRCPGLRVTVGDLCPDMLSGGRRRIFNARLAPPAPQFAVTDAQCLPFPDNSFDGYTISFGIRNVTDKPAALREALRVLKPGGFFACLEFSQPPEGAFKQLYRGYSFRCIPAIGKLAAGNESAYRYLAESIALFPDADAFKTMITAAGFAGARYYAMTNGVAAAHFGRKV